MSKFDKNSVVFQRARAMHALPIQQQADQLKEGAKKELLEAERRKLVNIMYHDGNYFVHEPQPDKEHKRDPDLIIEKHCWLVLKFMAKMRA